MKDLKIIGVETTLNKNAKKYKIRTGDDCIIETLYVNYSNKHIICFSTQVGCSVGCKFCSAGRFVRNLTYEELVNQCCLVRDKIKIPKKQKCGWVKTLDKPVLFSAMGVGEPVLNWNNVAWCLIFFNWKDSLAQNPNTNKFALSTMVPDMDKFFKLLSLLNKQNVKTKIQISLHSLNPDIRKNIFNDKSVELNLIERAGITASANFEIEYNYILMENINDSCKDAKLLVNWYKNTLIPIKLNRFNINGNVYKPSSTIDLFVSILRDNNVVFEQYNTNGREIKAACGQLVGGRC